MKTMIQTYIPIAYPSIECIVAATGINPEKIKALLHQIHLSRLSQTGYKPKGSRGRFAWIFNDGYVALHSSILRSLLGSSYRIYIDLLLRKQLLEIRSSSSSGEAYTAGTLCKHYRIPIDFFHSSTSPKHFRIENISGYTTLKAIRKTHARYNDASKRPLQHGIAIPKEYLGLLEMEKDVRFDTLSMQQPLNDIDSLNYSQIYNMALADAINKGEWSQKVDKYGERIHTPIKRINKGARRFMYFESIGTVSLSCLDICNSQLYFSSLLSYRKVISTFLPEFSKVAEIAEKYSESTDFKKYQEYCTNGTIYEYWMKETGLTRPDAKDELFQTLFASIRSRLPGVTRFREIFPSVAKMFYLIKSQDAKVFPFIVDTYRNENGVYSPSRNHCNLSCITQRLESRIFLGRIAKGLLDEKITPFITIHDSIILPSDLVRSAQTLMEKKFGELEIPSPTFKQDVINGNPAANISSLVAI